MAETGIRRNEPRLRPRQLLRELFRIAAGRPLHAGLSRRWIPGCRTSDISETLHLRDQISSLPARMRAPAGKRQSETASRNHRRRNRLDVQRQQTAPDAKTPVGAPSPHRDILRATEY